MPLMMTNEWSAMDLVLLIGVGVVAALAAGVSARRAVLGNRMDSSFEFMKRTRQRVSIDDVVASRASVRGTTSVRALHERRPMANNQASPTDHIPAGVHHVPLHERRAS